MLLKCKHCGKSFNHVRSKRQYCSRECASSAREKDLLGKTFGNLIVIKRLRNGGNGIGVVRLCKCKCGKFLERTTSKLLNGKNQSCGCYRRTAYGLIKTAFYYKYNSMHQRCEDPQSDSYPLYGGRGIKCEWKTFQDFYKDMYQSYIKHCEKYGRENTTIDRINPDGDYCKENCRWATPKEQANNTRRNRLIKCGDETLTLTQRAEKIGVTVSSLHGKLSRGVPMERIVKQPHKRRYSYYNIDEQLARYM